VRLDRETKLIAVCKIQGRFSYFKKKKRTKLIDEYKLKDEKSLFTRSFEVPVTFNLSLTKKLIESIADPSFQ